MLSLLAPPFSSIPNNLEGKAQVCDRSHSPAATARCMPCRFALVGLWLLNLECYPTSHANLPDSLPLTSGLLPISL